MLLFATLARAEDYYWKIQSLPERFSSPSAACAAWAKATGNPGEFTFTGSMKARDQTSFWCEFTNNETGKTAAGYGPAARYGDSCPADTEYNKETGECKENKCKILAGSLYENPIKRRFPASSTTSAVRLRSARLTVVSVPLKVRPARPTARSSARSPATGSPPMAPVPSAATWVRATVRRRVVTAAPGRWWQQPARRRRWKRRRHQARWRRQRLRWRRWRWWRRRWRQPSRRQWRWRWQQRRRW